MSARRAWAFPLLLSGEVVSVIGSGLSGFALGLFLLRKTGSVTAYTMLSLCGVLPALLVTPLAGAAVDRWPRKSVIVFSNLLCAALTAAMALIARTGRLQPWQIGALTALTSTVCVFHLLAFQVATALLVTPAQLGRANGLSQAGTSGAQLVAPAVAGALVAVLDLQAILAVDAASFAFAALAALLTPIDESAGAPAREQAARGSPLFGLRYLAGEPGLLGTLVFQTVTNLALGFAFVLLLPLVLPLGGAASSGAVQSTAGFGMLAGGLLVGAWGGPARRVRALYAGGAIMGAALVAGGVLRSVPAVGVCAFAIGLSTPLISSAAQVIWQLKVPADAQGRVFAARQAVLSATLPAAYLLAGPLADRLFEPAMASDGALAPFLAPVFGQGAGRGVALILFLMGVVSLLATAWAMADRRVRGVEGPLPAAVPDLGGAQ
jgi:MFS family permease